MAFLPIPPLPSPCDPLLFCHAQLLEYDVVVKADVYARYHAALVTGSESFKSG